jgi:hypothetical protein
VICWYATSLTTASLSDFVILFLGTHTRWPTEHQVSRVPFSFSSLRSRIRQGGPHTTNRASSKCFCCRGYSRLARGPPTHQDSSRACGRRGFQYFKPITGTKSPEKIQGHDGVDDDRKRKGQYLFRKILFHVSELM